MRREVTSDGKRLGPRGRAAALVIPLCVLAILWTVSAGSPQDQEVRLEITTSEVRMIRLYMAAFTSPSGGRAATSARQFEDVVTSDLAFSGLFDMKRIRPDEVSAILATLKGQGGLTEQYLVEGRTLAEGDKLIFEGRLFDAGSSKEVLSKRYKFGEGALRAAAHRFADEIVQQLTGDRGIASTSIAFISDLPGMKEVFVMDSDGKGLKRLTAEKSLCLSPKWSPDGQRIAYTSYSRGNPDLHVVGRFGGKPGVLSAFKGLNSSPAWSPDGRRIAMTLTKDGNAEIYLMNSDGSGLRRLTNNPAIDSSPSWSPNGRQIAFTSDRGGGPQVYVMESDGSNVRRLTFAGSYNDSPAWSPRGDRIAYASRVGNNFQIFITDLAGTGIAQLTFSRGNNENPSWSPDGRHLVFSSSRDGKRQIFVMNADGANVKRLTSSGENFSASWSPRFEWN
jgi:TolB protein